MNEENNIEPEHYSTLLYFRANFCKTENGQFEFVNDYNSMYTDKEVVSLIVLGVEQYNEIHDTDYKLSDNEVMSYYKGSNTVGDISFARDDTKIGFKVVKSLMKKKISSKLGMDEEEAMTPCYLMVVSDKNQLDQLKKTFYKETDKNYAKLFYYIQYDIEGNGGDCAELTEKLQGIQLDELKITVDNQYEIRQEFHTMYGSFLFLGIFFGLLFLISTTLIIYYKQVSEGYEDRERFIIMQKAGMSLAEVKKTIRTQILMVFFLPLVTAGIHEIVSYRIIEMILKILALGNESLFKICSIATFILFAILYGIVYRITAGAYYKIVSSSMR